MSFIRTRTGRVFLLGLAGQLVVAVPMMFKSLPITSGWYIAAASESRIRTPYKDFFWHMPPGSIFFEGVIPRLFSNSFVGHDIVHMAYWIVLWIFLFRLINYLESPEVAFIATSVAGIIYFVQPGNLIAGYFETSLGFQIAGLFYLVKGLDKSNRASLFVSGVLLGLSLSVRLSAAIFVFGLLLAWVFSVLRLIKNSYCRQLGLVVAGVALPWLMILFWSLSEANTYSLLVNIMQTDSKAGVSGWFGILSSLITSNDLNWFLIAILMSIFLKLENYSAGQDTIRRLRGLLAVLAFSQLVMRFPFEPALGGRYEGAILGVMIAGTFLLSRLDLVEVTPAIRNRAFTVMTLVVLVVTFFTWSIPMGASRQLLIDAPSWEDLVGFAKTATANAADIGVFGLIVALIWPERLSTQVDPALIRLVGLSIIAQKITDSTAGGATVETWLIGISLGLVLLIRLAWSFSPPAATATVFSIAITLLPGSVLLQRNVPYEWIGVVRPQLNSSTDMSIQVDGGKFYLPVNESVFIQEVEHVIEDEGIRSQPVFFSMRNIGLSELFDLERFPTRCLVLWFDVCPQSEARRTYEELLKDPPKYALVSFESFDVINSNEMFWNNGLDSYQRKIQMLFQPGDTSSKYETLVEFGGENGAFPVTRLLRRIDKSFE